MVQPIFAEAFREILILEATTQAALGEYLTQLRLKDPKTADELESELEVPSYERKALSCIADATIVATSIFLFDFEIDFEPALSFFATTGDDLLDQLRLFIFEEAFTNLKNDTRRDAAEFDEVEAERRATLVREAARQ
jgi:hypothetical protein